MQNYIKLTPDNGARVELHDKLGLTGSEISINSLPANSKVPFVHAHKENEEVYYILNGSGKFIIDDKEVSLNKGDVIKIVPAANRQLFAGSEGISYLCIQTKTNSLEEYTATDAIIK